MNLMARCFYGFASDKTEMQRNNIYSRLTSVRRKGTTYTGVNYNGTRYSYTEYYRQLVKEAEDLNAVERNGKTEYRFVFPNHMIIPLNKTQYEFALYLKENGFADDAKAEAFYAQEQQALREQHDKEKADEEAATEKRKEYSAQNKAMDSLLDQWVLDMEKEHPHAMAVARKISADHGYAYNARLLRILALMHNSKLLHDSAVARELYQRKMRESLYTDNKVSRKLFQLYSGMALPNTEKGTAEVLEKWYESPVVMTDEELLSTPKKKRTRRSSEAIAIMNILEENADNDKLKTALLKGRETPEQEYMLFNANRIYILYHPDPCIPIAEDETMSQYGYRMVDEYCSNLYDPIDREWTLKTIKTFMNDHPDSDFLVVNDDRLFVNPLFLQEALVILGDDAIFYRNKWFIIAKSDRGMAMMCMKRPKY